MIVISVSPGDYRTIMERDIIIFADSLSDIRKCGIRPPGMCIPEIRGYTIDDNNRIQNSYLFPYIDENLNKLVLNLLKQM